MFSILRSLRGSGKAVAVVSIILAALALVMTAFYITDRFNTAMAFINHPYSKCLFAVSALTGAGLSVLMFIRREAVPLFLLLIMASALMFLLVIYDLVFPSRILFSYSHIKAAVPVYAVIALSSSITSQIILIR